jgi:sulfur carrier protein ThiS
MKTFTLDAQQKHILQTLAPLIQEYKYSLAAKELLDALGLPPNKVNLLVREEIFPNPYTEFGEVKNAYLPLKLHYLSGQQKILRAAEKVRQAQLRQEEIQERKQQLLKSLLRFAKIEPEKIVFMLEEFKEGFFLFDLVLAEEITYKGKNYKTLCLNKGKSNYEE